MPPAFSVAPRERWIRSGLSSSFSLNGATAAFGGSSGLMWADALFPRAPVERKLLVSRQIAWWIAAAVLGLAYILIVGPGIEFIH